MSETADVVVVGGGILGVSVAHALAHEGLAVTLLEKNGVGSGTSSHTFAWLNATSKYADEHYHHLNAAGMARHRELAQAFGEDRLGLGGSGMLTWTGNGDSASLDALESQYARLQSFAYPVRWLEAAELASIEPHMRFPDDAQGLIALADAWVDGVQLTRFLAHRVRALGGDIREGCRVRELSRDARGRVSGVVSDNGVIASAMVVLAAGPATAALVKVLCADTPGADAYPMRRVKGLLLETPSLEPWRWLRHVHYTTCFGELHMRPANSNALLLGAEDLDESIADDESEAALQAGAGIMLERLRNYLPAIPPELTVERSTPFIGVRPMPADGLPIVGPLPSVQGLYVMTAHSGMTLGPLLGDLVAEEVVHGRMPAMLAPYRYERFETRQLESGQL